MALTIDFQFPDWAKAVKRHEGRLNLFLAAQVQANRGMLFDSEGRRNRSESWPTLKFRNGMVLSNRGALRKSISPYNPRGTPGPSGIVRFTEDTIVVGTSLLYARMMNDGTTKMPGGVLRPKNAKALRIPLPSGQNATQTAKDIRASGPKTNMSAKQQQRLQNARDRASRAAAQNVEAQTPQSAAALQRAQATLAKARTAAARKLNQRAKIRSTGKGGKGFIFVQSVRIPARPFDQWTPLDQQEIDNALKTELIGILNDSTR